MLRSGSIQTVGGSEHVGYEYTLGSFVYRSVIRMYNWRLGVSQLEQHS